MGVYIDIEKPKECEECLFYEYDSVFEDERWSSAPKCLLDGDSDDCPLIEIDLVKCEECEWSNGECSVGERFQGGCTFGERKTE